MKKEPILQYVDDMITVHEKRDATDKELSEIKKRYAPKRRDTWKEFVASGGKELPKLSRKEIEQVRADRRVRDYMLRNYKPKKSKGQFEKIVSNLHKKPASPVRTASMWSSIKNSSIYKLLENEKLMGTELGHEALIELIHLAQNSGLMKKGGRVK